MSFEINIKVIKFPLKDMGLIETVETLRPSRLGVLSDKGPSLLSEKEERTPSPPSESSSLSVMHVSSKSLARNTDLTREAV
jgi:hypothetical protein